MSRHHAHLTKMDNVSTGFSVGIMAPKRRAASGGKRGGKKVKQEPETPEPKDAFTSAKEALLAAGPQVKGKRNVDEHCSLPSSNEVGRMVHNISIYSVT